MHALRRDKLLHGWRDPVAPRPAATLLLVRDSNDGLQVLMTQRSPTASFAPGVFVFPGGQLDAADIAPSALAVSRTLPHQDSPYLHHAHAALREAFEELGILVAHPKGQDTWVDPAHALALNRSQDADFYGQLAVAGLELATHRTGWWAQWTTDPDLPRRFQVRFLVAPMPHGQEAVADGAEQFEPRWVNPGEALQAHEAGDFKMIFPTIRTLRQLQRFGRAEQVIDSAQDHGRVYVSFPRGGLVKGKESRYTEDEMQYGEVEMVSPDGKLVHTLDWRTDQVVPLRKNVARLTCPNPGMMTGPGTNTYIVGEAGQGFVVIDPGPEDVGHIERIAAFVGNELQAIVCTHSHPDHSPGAPLLKRLCGGTAPILGLSSRPTANEQSQFVAERELADEERIRVGDSTLRVIHTPGHAANHLCLVLEEDHLLFSGDHVLNGSTTVVNPPDGDMYAYLASLDRLCQQPVDFILPAHGHVLGPAITAMKKLIAHRMGREAKVIAALQKTGGGTLDTLVPHAYDDVDRALYPVAKRSLQAHLDKLVIDAKATVAQGHYALS